MNDNYEDGRHIAIRMERELVELSIGERQMATQSVKRIENWLKVC